MTTIDTRAPAPLRRNAGPSRLGRALAAGDTLTWLCLLAVLLAPVVLAVAHWGLVALGLVALAAVPVIFLVLVLLTVGK